MTKIQQLALPNPKDWCTVSAAAEMLNLSARQVRRYVHGQVLQGYTPRIGSRESHRTHLMVSVAQVEELRDARAKMAPANG